MTNWTAVFKPLPNEKFNKLAVLRIVACPNGIIQYILRNGDADALSLEEARQAMGFSRSTIRSHTITIESH